MSERRGWIRWGAVAARIIAAAATGGGVGWFLSAVMDSAARGAARECADADADGMLCLGLGSIGLGFVASVVGVAVAWVVCAWWAGLEQRAATIPLGLTVALLVVLWFPAERGRFHPTWSFALAMAVGFAAMAGVLRLLDGAAGSRRRGWAALGVVLAVVVAAMVVSWSVG
ncbi:hypothetical protein R8Z50_26090 [Longispora sp. K20-0274]|uniref:hypothetical protein n=1 Tax=Longispora sp. K20-0274 TaxID=3088255 RepID=UPI0039999CF8